MFWFLYIAITFFLSHLIAGSIRKHYSVIMLFLLVLFLTPSQVEVGGDSISPSLFTFIYGLVLEKDYSLRVLRPLFITLPITIIFSSLFLFIRRKLFPH